MKSITHKKAHEILQYILRKAGCEIVCYIGKYVRVKHVDSDQYGMLLSIDVNGNWKLPSLEYNCYNPKRRECILLKWIASESALGKRVIAHLDNNKHQLLLERNSCLEQIAIEADVNSII